MGRLSSFLDLLYFRKMLVSAVAAALLFSLQPELLAQTLTVLHNFTGGRDGSRPQAGLTLRGQTLYGTASSGGDGGFCQGTCGTAFKLTYKGSGWVFSPLYEFQGGEGQSTDGSNPIARVVFGPNGSLYGTTTGLTDNGTVYNLMPPATPPVSALQTWNHTVLHRFSGSDGDSPQWGDLVFDQAGRMYGTTEFGGSGAEGTVYRLVQSQGTWTESVIYSFADEGGSGILPESGVVLDSSGNLYGTTYGGGNGWGTVYELSLVGSTWVRSDLYTFQGSTDGIAPYSGVVFDQQGNLYGATTAGGAHDGGTVFQLAPSNGGWTFSLLYSFSGNGGGPVNNLVMDAAGNLYGTTSADGAHGLGSVFELSRDGGSWSYNDLHDFTGGSDGSNPNGVVTLDINGNLYGTAWGGGADNKGVVWEITP